MEPRIKEGTLVVVRESHFERHRWASKRILGIVREKIREDLLVVDGGPHGNIGIYEEDLIPLAEIPPEDQELTPEEALRKYLPEVIITLAKKTFGIPISLPQG